MTWILQSLQRRRSSSTVLIRVDHLFHEDLDPELWGVDRLECEEGHHDVRCMNREDTSPGSNLLDGSVYIRSTFDLLPMVSRYVTFVTRSLVDGQLQAIERANRQKLNGHSSCTSTSRSHQHRSATSYGTSTEALHYCTPSFQSIPTRPPSNRTPPNVFDETPYYDQDVRRRTKTIRQARSHVHP